MNILRLRLILPPHTIIKRTLIIFHISKVSLPTVFYVTSIRVLIVLFPLVLLLSIYSTQEHNIKVHFHLTLTSSSCTSTCYVVLGFLRRNLSMCNTNINILAFKTLVRPHLEYCDTVWDSHTHNNINRFEAIQNKAAR